MYNLRQFNTNFKNILNKAKINNKQNNDTLTKIDIDIKDLQLNDQ